MKKNEVVEKNINYTSSENFFFKKNYFSCFIGGAVVGIIFSLLANNEYLLLVLPLILGIASVFIFIKSDKIEISERNEFLEQTIDEIEKIKKSDITYMSLTLDLKWLTINENTEKITFYNGVSIEPIEINYQDILSFELTENGSQKIEGKGSETYLASKYLGSNAALAVANSSRNINNFCNSLSIEIHLKELSNTNIKINLIMNTKVDKNTEDYLILYEFAKNIIVTLDKLMKKIDNNSKVEISEPTYDNFDELRKYKELFDDNVITKEEFEAKKRILLK